MRKDIRRERFSLAGLKQCLKKFDEDGRSASWGKWSIGRGGYDLNWELYYENQPVVDCMHYGYRDDELRIVNEYGNCNILNVILKIQEVYTDVKFRIGFTWKYNKEEE